MTLYILGMGCAHPEARVVTQMLEDLDIGTTVDWIHTYIGIKQRAVSLPLDYIARTFNQDPREGRKHALQSPTDLAYLAAQQALKSAGISAKQIGLVICNTCTPYETGPGEAQRLAARMGIEGQAYDVISACPAFALHVRYLKNFREEKLPEYVLCFSTATLSQRVNYKDRSDGAIWGDGAAAWVMSTRHLGKLRVTEATFMADPTRCSAVVVDSCGHFHQDGRAVRDFSVRQTVRMLKKMEEEYQLDWNKDVFIGHQANKTMLEQICNNREIPERNHWHNVTDLGNQAGAGAPAVLAMHWDSIKPGQRIAVAVVGAGLSWGSILLECD